MATTKLSGRRRFAAFWARSVERESDEWREIRGQVVGDARGDLLEIGFGIGTNWDHIPEDVCYTGIEPDGYMLERARARTGDFDRELTLLDAKAEELPFADNSFDTVVSTLTFCTIADVPKALAEVERVLRPGGEFRFFEHVRPRGRVAGGVSTLIRPLWNLVGGGCNPNRKTLHAIRDHGFDVRLLQPRSGPFGVMAVGVATPASGGTAR